MAKKNIALLKRLRTRFLGMRHKQHFNMDYIAIRNERGTAMCIAGHTLDLEGYKVKFDEADSPIWFTPSGRRMTAGGLEKASRLLGLSYGYNGLSEGYNLFHDFSLTTPKKAAIRITELIEEG